MSYAFPARSTAESKNWPGLWEACGIKLHPRFINCVIFRQENEVIYPRLGFLISNMGTIVDTRVVVRIQGDNEGKML